MASYIGVIHRKEPGMYSVCFPDFPDCLSAGKTLSEAFDLAKTALTEHIALKIGYGESLKTPLDMKKVLADPAYSEGIAYISVEAEAAVKIRRISLTMDEALLKKIDAASSNRSAFLAEAARHYLRLTS